jgi:parallel beta-helix repeat protein
MGIRKRPSPRRRLEFIEPLEGRFLLSRDIYVDINSPGPTRDGTSWEQAFVDLQDGLAAALSGDRILVADGTYKPTSGTDRAISFVLKNGVAMYGGYAGYGAAQPDTRNPSAFPSIMSGDLGQAGNMADNSYHVISASNLNASAVLDGFIITSGNANGSSASNRNRGGGMYNSSSNPTVTNCTFSGNSASYGGAMYNSSSSPTLTDCTFSGNSASYGGAMYNSSSSPTLTNCTFRGNSASYTGGGMYNDSSSPTLTNCTFSGNSADYGGGMYNSSSSPTLTDCAFSANSASGSGGAMDNYDSSPTLTNCTFSGNSATGVTASGGAIFNGSSSPTLTNCTFSGNSASYSGGGMYNYSANPTLTNCAFSANSASGSGGAMANVSSNPTLSNCTFSGNVGRQGGAVYDSFSNPTLTNCAFSGNSASGSGGAMANASSSPTLTSCTFSGNSASDSGGGMNNSFSSPTLTNCTFSGNLASLSGGGMRNAVSTVTLTSCTLSGNSASDYGGGMFNLTSSSTLVNCILWGNLASSGAQIFHSGGTTTATYCDIQGGFPGTGNIDADPLFVRSLWAGPDGLFGTADDDAGDLRLRAGSPALDIGSNAAVPPGVTTDLAGNARIQNNTVDLGAYEGPLSVPPPKVIYVDINASGADSGASWTDAFTSLSSALLAAIDGDTIRVADGTYKPTATTDRTLSFALRQGVGIYGGYAGYGAADPDARNVALYASVLSGDIGATGDNSDNSYHVVTSLACDATATLNGFTITGGNANGSGNYASGGGLYNATSSPTLTNCTLTGNTANDGGGMYSYSSSPTLINCTLTGNSANSGGGMYNTSSSSPTVTNCTFTGNSADWEGGGMYNYSYSSPTLSNCTFSGNSADGHGGGMYSYLYSSPTLSNCTFSGNSANYGGGMYNYSYSSPTLTNCTFSGNSAGSNGGGMDNYDSSPTLSNCTFSGNSANYGGGMFNLNSSSPTLTNCTFSGNSAGSNGGGMYNYSSWPTLSNCTFSGNSASSGGGIYDYWYSWPTVTNCTFSGNSANYDGGGMYNDYHSSPTMSNCILWGNIAPSGSQIHDDPGSMSVITYSDIQGGFTGTGNTNSDPLFVRNPSPGADGVWGTPDDDYGDLRLQPNSPCIDAGNNAAVAADTLDLDGDGNTAEPIPFDLAGGPRFWDYPGKADTGSGTAPVVDMGAYEMSSLLIASTASPDQVYLRLDPAGVNVQVWVNADPAAAPTYTAPLSMPSSMGIWMGGDDDTITIDASNGNPIPPSGLLVDGGVGNDTLTLTGTNSADELIAHAGGLSLSGRALTAESAEKIQLNSTGPAIALGALSIADTTIALAPGGKVLGTGALSITGTGRLNLKDNDLIVASSSLPAVQALIQSAYNNGSWNGPGITSDMLGTDKALGYAAGNDPAIAHLGGQLNGQPFGPGSVIVKHTYAADGNLDGQVDVVDLGILATHWQGEGRIWTSADFNYSPNGKVDVVDLGILATHWQKGVGSPLGLPLDLSAFGLASAGESGEPAPPAPQVRIAAGRKVGMLNSGIGAIDFGTVAVSLQKPGPQRTLRVTNTGDGPLELRLRKLPKGFALVEPLDRSLMPGESDTFTVQMSRKAAASHARALIRIDSNDPTQARFDIPITGIVLAGSPRAARSGAPAEARPAPSIALAPIFSAAGAIAPQDADLLHRLPVLLR